MHPFGKVSEGILFFNLEISIQIKQACFAKHQWLNLTTDTSIASTDKHSLGYSEESVGFYALLHINR